jgi:hypothetical protein
VDGCFDGVGCVEGGGGEVDFLEGRFSKSVRLLTTTTRAMINEETHHEVTPHKPNPLLQLFPHSMRRRPLHLIRIVIQPDNFTARERRYLACRLPDSAADIKDRHGGVDADPVGEVVFVAGQRLQEGFSRGEAAEVEGLRPGFFVEVGDEVVVAVVRTNRRLALRGRSWG